MEPQGISVTEIRLGLPNTHYFLCWEPACPPQHPIDRRALLRRIRDTSRRQGWSVYAAGCDDGVARLVFSTSTDNLESGLAGVLHDARRWRVYMVQPRAVLPLIARHVRETNAAARSAGRVITDDWPTALPQVHYGMFMGERAWAERMLDLLTRGSQAAAPHPRRFESLGELAGRYASRRDAITEAYRSGRFSLKDIAEHFDMHFSEVSAVVNASAPEG